MDAGGGGLLRDINNIHNPAQRNDDKGAIGDSASIFKFQMKPVTVMESGGFYHNEAFEENSKITD